jgi:hypothetical protein
MFDGLIGIPIQQEDEERPRSDAVTDPAWHGWTIAVAESNRSCRAMIACEVF